MFILTGFVRYPDQEALLMSDERSSRPVMVIRADPAGLLPAAELRAHVPALGHHARPPLGRTTPISAIFREIAIDVRRDATAVRERWNRTGQQNPPRKEVR